MNPRVLGIPTISFQQKFYSQRATSRRGKFSTTESFREKPTGSETTSCQNFGTTNMNLIRISTVPGGTVQTKIFSTNQKRLGTN